MKSAKMTQKQMQELLGVSKSSFAKWLSEKDNPKHNLALLIANMDYEETVKQIMQVQLQELPQNYIYKEFMATHFGRDIYGKYYLANQEDDSSEPMYLNDEDVEYFRDNSPELFI